MKKILFFACTLFCFASCMVPLQSSFYQQYESIKKQTADSAISLYLDENNQLFVFLAKEEMRGDYLRIIFEKPSFKDSIDVLVDPVFDPYISVNCDHLLAGRYLTTVMYRKCINGRSIANALYTDTIYIKNLTQM